MNWTIASADWSLSTKRSNADASKMNKSMCGEEIVQNFTSGIRSEILGRVVAWAAILCVV